MKRRSGDINVLDIDDDEINVASGRRPQILHDTEILVFNEHEARGIFW